MLAVYKEIKNIFTSLDWKNEGRKYVYLFFTRVLLNNIICIKLL